MTSKSKRKVKRQKREKVKSQSSYLRLVGRESDRIQPQTTILKAKRSSRKKNRLEYRPNDREHLKVIQVKNKLKQKSEIRELLETLRSAKHTLILI